ncbi:metal ABC transporter solute-binding protein, Zn/Mn family [Virgibacillus senegalensis]|uniref:metal ABC transporter solute-binding protein, Zn/Mn family n=1 Tax=Virgibacillus senegalensis TaxID=1499679 RepID=UPI00069DB550|nr:zinc ABC transporter substrate-binding protein [Virgibacillus senegalensis]
MRQIIRWLFLCSVLAILVSCSPSPSEKAAPTIYTTVYPVQYILERLAGDFTEVATVYPPGADAHSYEPTAKTMTDIAEGEAFFYLGEELEAFASTTADALQQEDVKLIGLGGQEELFHSEGKEDTTANHDEIDPLAHDHSDHDPHVWLDPLRMLDLAVLIEKRLSDMYPDQQAVMQQNLLSLKEDLRNLDRQFVRNLNGSKHREILVSHAAYGYWEERYGIHQIAVNGMSNDSEPSQKDLIEIIERAKHLDMEYVIFEQNVPDHVSKEVQKEIDGKPLQIHNLAVLSERDIERGEDYFSLMEKNLEVLKKATE